MKTHISRRQTIPTAKQGILTTDFIGKLSDFIPQTEFYEVEFAEVMHVPEYSVASQYGQIYCKILYNQQYTSIDDTIMMLPRSPYDIDIPVVGELVLCSRHPSIQNLNSRHDLITDQYYYFDIYGILNKQNHNVCMGGFAPTDEDFKTYSTDQDTMGRIFISNQQHIPQLPYQQGDKLITGRYGNCIRFTHEFNSNKDKMLPQIKISNNNYKCISPGESKSIRQHPTISGASLYLYYYEQQPDNLVALSSSRNKLDEISQFSLLGNGILLNSDKLLFNSVVGDIQIYSKKALNLSSVDNIILQTKHIQTSTNTINVQSLDSINISTKQLNANINKQLSIITPKLKLNSDSISLGQNATQPIVLGNQLIALLSQLCVAISSISVVSGAPGSPTSPPINAAQFSAISAKLNTILSKISKTK